MNRNIPLRSSGRRKNAALLAVVIAAHLGLPETLTANKTWTAGNGNWNVPGNWTPSGVPTGGDAVFLTQNDSTNRVVTYDDPFNLTPFANVLVNATGAGSMHLVQNGFLFRTDNLALGTTGKGIFEKTAGTLTTGAVNMATAANGAGTFIHSGGVSNVTTFTVGAFRPATVSWSGGTLNGTILNLGSSGAGTFLQTGGHVIADALRVSNGAGGGTYELTGGTLTAGVATINTGGTMREGQGGRAHIGSLVLNGGQFTGIGSSISNFFHNGGTIANSPNGFFNNTGSYFYNGGVIQGNFTHIGTSMTFNADWTLDGSFSSFRNLSVPAGRTITINGAELLHGNGTLTIQGTVNTKQTRVIADDIVLAGGVHNVGTLQIGFTDSPATYTIQTGTLDATAGTANGNVIVGYIGGGSLNMTLGRLRTNQLWIGGDAPGRLALAGGGTIDADQLVVGLFGVGSLVQSGVPSRVNAQSLLTGVFAPGTYAISNGTLAVTGSMTVGAALVAGVGTFAQTGGRAFMLGTLSIANAASSYRMSGGTLQAIDLPTINNGSFLQSGGVATLRNVEGSGTMDVSGSSSLTVRSIRQHTLIISDNARVFSLAGGVPQTVSRVNQLFFEESEFNVDGKWDLTNNHLVIDHDPGAGNLFYNNARLYIQSGFNLGSWTGDGLNSSAAIAAASTTEKTGLGYARADQVFNTFPANFVGQTVDDSSVLVRYTLLGDNNLDGTVNIGDFANLAAHFNLPGDWVHGDYDYNAQVNIADFALLASNFNKSLSGATARPGAVPEPTAGLILVAAGLLARRRR